MLGQSAKGGRSITFCADNLKENKMTTQPVTIPQPAAKSGCCGGDAAKDKAVAAAASKPIGNPVPETKAPAKAGGSCCGGDSHAKDNH